MRPKRSLVAERVVALHILVPQPDRFLPFHRLQLYRRHLPHRPHHLLLGIGSRARHHLRLAPPRRPPQGQLHQTQSFQLAQSLRARAHLVPPRRRHPVQMLANRPHQLPPAQPPKHPHRFLQIFDFLYGEGTPRKEQRRSVSHQGPVSLPGNPHCHLKSDSRCPDPLCEKINFRRA